MTRDVTFRDRLRYNLDNSLSRGAIAIIAWLAVLSAVIVLIAGATAVLAGIAPHGEEPLGFAEATWASLMRTLDPGTMGSDEGWSFRAIMLLVTLGGIFVISTLIGAITSGIESKLVKIRKGRSRVIESDHTVILGWCPQVYTIIAELVTANENRRRPRVAVLAERDKTEMEDEIRARVPNTGRTRVICRTGSPIDPTDLNIVSVDTARSVIVLPTTGREPDAEVIKAVLAVTQREDRRASKYHIVGAIREPANLDVARIVGGTEVEWIVVGDLVARVVAQTCLQAGLSTVYMELLDFAGDEIYVVEVPELVGKTFGEALVAFDDSSLLGIQPAVGNAQLCPNMDTTIGDADRLIVVTADDDTATPSTTPHAAADLSAIVSSPPHPRSPDRILILGWNWRGPAIIRELDYYVGAGSELVVVANDPIDDDVRQRCCPDLRHLTVEFHQAATSDRAVLNALGLEAFDHVIVLGYADSMEPQQADSRSLMTLFQLRHIKETSGCRFSLVTEVMDPRNQRLAEIAKVDDFVVSEQLANLILAQVSEDKALSKVFEALFNPEGSEIYLKPATNYVQAHRPVSFYTVVEAARQRGEVAFGYRKLGGAAKTDLKHGVVINPVKSDLVTFTEADRVIVLAEE